MITQRFIHVSGGGVLSYETHGYVPSSRPLLLLRPLGGSMALWGHFREALARTRRVISFDPLGVGISSDAPALSSTRDMAKDALELADALDLGTFDVFGLSLGGMVASWLAVDAPDRVRKLVLASEIPSVGDLSAHGLRTLVGMGGCLLRVGVDAELCAIRRVLSSEFQERCPGRMAEIEAMVRAQPMSRRNLLALSFAASTHGLGDRLADLRAPTLVLVGDRDQIVSQKARDDLMTHLSHAQLQVIADCGHDLTIEQPFETARRVATFLDADG